MSDVYAYMSVQNFFLEVGRIYSRNGMKKRLYINEMKEGDEIVRN